MLLISNGLELFHTEVCSTESLLPIENGLIAFHNWGNGDVDCMTTLPSERGPVGAIVYLGHDPLAEGRVAVSLIEWLDWVAETVQAHGYLGHPYNGATDAFEGPYAAVKRFD